VRRLLSILRTPIFWVLALALAAGSLVFRDYGLTWDEPLFYKYADALGYAYTPANWIGGQFDLSQSYGPSGDDHKNRGPAYLLLAREPVYLLERLNIDSTSAWHLINFITFLVGVGFLYGLMRHFVHQGAAAATAAFFAAQPLLWGHSFINPKDMPFLVFFLGAVWLGFRMVDRLVDDQSPSRGTRFLRVLFPAALLGVATANRVLGPLAGLLVLIYFIARGAWRRGLVWILAYVVVAAAVIIASWPYLWESPFRFVDVFRFMADNPTNLQVLFADHIYRAFELPRRYLPFLLLTNLSEPVWPLFVVGLLVAGFKFRADRRGFLQALLILGWFMVPIAYVLLARPPLYDGMRHFLFILPPVFVFVALAIDFIFERIGWKAVNAVLALGLLVPGILGIAQLHPYEYAYYNSFVGGTGAVFRHYETEYWLTCYREAVQHLDATVSQPSKLFVHREAEVAQPFAAANFTVLDQRGAVNTMSPGDFLLVSTRTNEDRQAFRDAPMVLTIGRAGATFCVVKQIP
jgi:Dolichyl-phosphate-mannose-protein mannosyltransferase